MKLEISYVENTNRDKLIVTSDEEVRIKLKIRTSLEEERDVLKFLMRVAKEIISYKLQVNLRGSYSGDNKICMTNYTKYLKFWFYK